MVELESICAIENIWQKFLWIYELCRCFCGMNIEYAADCEQFFPLWKKTTSSSMLNGTKKCVQIKLNDERWTMRSEKWNE